ncbi:MAG: mitochondrial fission ELM1 family protein [Dyella sp.]
MLSMRDECWMVTDGAAGNQRQAFALAERLPFTVRPLDLQARAPWRWWAPRQLPGGRLALPADQRDGFAPPWPRVAIGCGRIGAHYTRMLRRLSGGRSYTVQILDPRVDPAHWDTVIAPAHDRLRGANVIQPLGSLNPIDDAWLAEGREAFATLAALPQPRIGVLLGGPRRGITLDRHYAAQLIALLRRHQQREGGSLLVLASRRTPSELADTLRAALNDLPGLHWRGPGDGPNPYPGVLAWADRLVVTPDSVNMLSEACAVGCTVQTLLTDAAPAKLRPFHQALRASGRLHDLADPHCPARQPPLRETAAIAQELQRRISAHATP